MDFITVIKTLMDNKESLENFIFIREQDLGKEAFIKKDIFFIELREINKIYDIDIARIRFDHNEIDWDYFEFPKFDWYLSTDFVIKNKETYFEELEKKLIEEEVYDN